MSSKDYKIDFKLIQTALLPKLQDKQFLQTLILSVSVTDQIILNSSIKNLPVTLQTSVTALGLQSALDSSVLLSSLYRLTKQLVGLSIDQAKQKAKQLFPSDFDSKLRNGILNQVFQNYDEIRSQFIKSKSALSKLKDFDWRIETQIASKYQKDTKPTLLLRLDTQKEVGMTKSTTLQLPRSKVKEMLNVFHRIDSQLKAITGKN